MHLLFKMMIFQSVIWVLREGPKKNKKHQLEDFQERLPLENFNPTCNSEDVETEPAWQHPMATFWGRRWVEISRRELLFFCGVGKWNFWVFFSKICFFSLKTRFFGFSRVFSNRCFDWKTSQFLWVWHKNGHIHGFVSKSPHRLTDVPIFPKAFWAKPWQALEISRRFGFKVTCLLFKVAIILYTTKVINDDY